MTEIGYKLAIIFIPGIVGRFLLARFMFFRDRDKFYFTIHAFLLGIASYVLLDIFTGIYSYVVNWDNPIFFSTTATVIDLTTKQTINISKILWATILSIFIAGGLSCLERKGFIMALAQRLGATSRFAEPDVWGYIHNSPWIQENQWAIIRDRNNDIMYQGLIKAFSDPTEARELFLLNVNIYKNTTAELMYHVNALYLTLEPQSIEIEYLPTIEENENGE